MHLLRGIPTSLLTGKSMLHLTKDLQTQELQTLKELSRLNKADSPVKTILHFNQMQKPTSNQQMKFLAILLVRDHFSSLKGTQKIPLIDSITKTTSPFLSLKSDLIQKITQLSLMIESTEFSLYVFFLRFKYNVI